MIGKATIIRATGITCTGGLAGLRDWWNSLRFDGLTADAFYKKHEGTPPTVKIAFADGTLCSCSRSANTFAELEALVGERCPHGWTFVEAQEGI